MKWIRRSGVYAVLACLLLLLPRVMEFAPSPPAGMAAKKYEGYSGVLKMWVCEGWQCGTGSLCGWLNECISSFERAHNGVYVQLTQVSREMLTLFDAAQVIPPDLLAFSPGMLEKTGGLTPLEADYPLREGLDALGCAKGVRYAVPVALGGYCFAYNRQFLEELPDNWGETELPKSKKPPEYLLHVPQDDAGHSWSAALIASLCGTHEHPGNRISRPGEGMDLGLPTATPSAQMLPEPVWIKNALPELLPADFRARQSVYSAFTRSEVCAIPVTQRELWRLEGLSQSGKAPDYAVGFSGRAFTDQALLIAVTALERPDRRARQALGEALIAHLLDEQMQSKLASARAYAVIDCAPLYAGGSVLSTQENALSAQDLLIAPVFSNAWREQAKDLADRMQRGEITPQEAFERLENLLKNAADSQV